MNTFFQVAPSGWKRVPLKYLAESPKNGAWGDEVGESDIDAICVRVADFNWGHMKLDLSKPTIRSFKSAQIDNLRLRPGDIILEKSGGGEKTPVGRVAKFNNDELSVTSNFVARVRPLSNVDPDFLLYVLAAQYMSKFSLQYVKQNTGIQNLDDTRLFRSDVWVPVLPAQKRVAAFLDRETARIDELIAKKERLGGVIDQRRIAVITAAVAGQIGPATEKLATKGTLQREIRLRFMLQVAPSAREIENLTADDEVTFAPMDAIDDGLGGLDASMSRPLGEVAAGSYNYFREGDVLLAKVTPCFENGKKALSQDLINGVGFATSEVYVFRPRPGRLDARFLMYLFSSEDFRADGMKSMTGAGGLKRVSDTAILNYRPHVVDVSLQRKVADFLDQEMEVFEVIKDRTMASIDRLREYRSSLITAAVTGQIDVDTFGKTGTTSATLDQIEEEMQA